MIVFLEKDLRWFTGKRTISPCSHPGDAGTHPDLGLDQSPSKAQGEACLGPAILIAHDIVIKHDAVVLE
jgi:hypothetical protein